MTTHAHDTPTKRALRNIEAHLKFCLHLTSELYASGGRRHRVMRSLLIHYAITYYYL